MDPQQAASEQIPQHPAAESGAVQSERETSTFQPIYTLLNNSSTRTTHHPQVHYIFSDDDPDILTQALARQHDANMNESASGPAPDHRAILLDLSPDKNGSFNVAWATSLSPSWAVLDAQVSRISPPSSDGGGPADRNTNMSQKEPDRLMLRIEGIEGGSLTSSSELRLSDERSGPGSGSGSGSGSGQRAVEAEDYNSLVEDFDKRMAMLRKVVDAGEERQRKIAAGPEIHSDEVDDAALASAEDLKRSVDSG